MTRTTYSISWIRVGIVLGCMLLLLLAIVARLYYLQIIYGAKYTNLARNNRVNTRVLCPKRGALYDDNGTVLATNKHRYRLLLSPTSSAALRLRRYKETYTHLQALLDTNMVFDPKHHVLCDDLSWAQVSKIEANRWQLPHCEIKTVWTRHYSLGAQACHVIGHMGTASKDDPDKWTYQENILIGKGGTEGMYDNQLRGKAGYSEVEVDVRGRVVRELDHHASTTGSAVKLTLNAALQSFIAETLIDKDYTGCVVVMQPHTGAIKALVSNPAFDPHLFSAPISHKDWGALRDNKERPLVNKAIAGLYPPASVFKPVSLLAGLYNNVISSRTVFSCKNKLEVGNTVFHCWFKYGHGPLGLTQSLSRSCDVYYYELARLLNIDHLYEAAHELGFGHRSGLGMLGEQSGLVPSKAWKRRRFKSGWYKGETCNAVIGQGYTQATPLQMGVMLSRVCNGGYKVEPHLHMDKQPIYPRLMFEEKHIKRIKKGLDQAVQGNRGTGRRLLRKPPDSMPVPSKLWRYDDAGQPLTLADKEKDVKKLPHDALKKRLAQLNPYHPWLSFTMGGKSGTGQVRRISAAERKKGIRSGKGLARHLRDHSMFAGYYPANNPQYVVVAVVEHGGWGLQAAGPLARDVLYYIHEKGLAAQPERPLS
jgi:penicillin-binding protein 2